MQSSDLWGECCKSGNPPSLLAWRKDAVTKLLWRLSNDVGGSWRNDRIKLV